MAQTSGVTTHRNERILAFMIAAAVGLSIICIIALIVGNFTGATTSTTFVALWRFVTVLPLVGLPIGLVLMIALLVVSAVRRSRESKDA